MKLHLESISSWSTSGAEKTNNTDGMQKKSSVWPKLEFVPAMQRRRLSPFAKIALYTAENALSAASTLAETSVSEAPELEMSELEISKQLAQIDIVFSSRHGDLHKTSTLLTDLAAEQDISPTAFSTSVHNAVPGLYSILKQNKQAINAISAGKDSFFYAFVDAYARLKSGRANKLLIVHVDRELPELYSQFQDEQQVDHAVAMVVTLTPTPATIANIDINFSTFSGADNGDKQGVQQDTAELNLPAALCFINWFDTNLGLTPKIVSKSTLQYTSDRHIWTCDLISGSMNV
ncbi:beta-ketoacyl synthase chain length factor [Moritella sp.]|uniref:beta-ketoacyl synthase chain length factor n=1 Tax=Moritella sp. TaxID=78556 RepID=UPI001D3BFD29|nr:beta-ketoacyl synthase chain length factor [Moritella sp.]MCJ8350392.1 beta-ketoacyl synthase chain length factor [Moritella sp.]NQZ40087.1 beta-ketoacyl synthase chain length factor [Moritella sp.]